VPDRDSTLRLLNQIRIVAILDFLLLIPLVLAMIAGNDTIKPILGPIHGVGFLLMLFLCVKGAGEDRWGWWFPVLVVVTLGPIGSLLGDRRVRRDLRAATV
jgi:integral membrane protein